MATNSFPRLLSPLSSLGLGHRMVMAPLTRIRGNAENFAPGPLAVDYYTQRASRGGLLITEAAPISPETPYENAPGIFTLEHERGWKEIVDKVHAKGCKISLQMWHLGRMSHQLWAQHTFLRSLNRPLGSVSASSVPAPGHARDFHGEKHLFKDYPPRALETHELQRVVSDYVEAAERAKRCGFDFVEIHGAHGYLLNQFLCDGTNHRTDEFGTQSFENRTRLLKMVLDGVIGVMGNERVAIRISPTYSDTFSYQGCSDSNPEKLYRDVVAWLDQFNLGYLLLSEPRWNGGRMNVDAKTDPTFSLPLRNGWARDVYKGTLIGSSSFTPLTAEKALEDGVYDAIAFGRFFISNPDFVERVRLGATLNEFDASLFYTKGREGYVDYPDLGGSIPGSRHYPQIEIDAIGKLAHSPKPRL